MKISDLLALAENQLKNSGVSNSRLDALVLLTHALSVSKEQIIFYPDFEPAKNLQKKFLDFVQRRTMREPVSQIIGTREFYGYNFFVTHNTLDPRPDSESLIELVLKKFPERNHDFRILEIGTGTGCLIITLLQLYKNAKAIAIDISEEALKICRKNLAAHTLEQRLEIKKSDLFSALSNEQRFDLIISNPPYIPSRDICNLQEEVKNFEPHLALDGGADGLDFYHKIAKTAPLFLQKQGCVIVEIGFGQENDVIQIFSDSGFLFEQTKPDLSGIARALSFQLSH